MKSKTQPGHFKSERLLLASQRVLATFIDIFVAGGILQFFLVFTLIVGRIGPLHGLTTRTGLIIIALAVLIVSSTIAERRLGATIGMQPFRIMVRRYESGEVSLLRSVLRNIFILVDFVLFPISFVLVAATPSQRTAGDRLSGTVVAKRPPQQERT